MAGAAGVLYLLTSLGLAAAGAYPLAPVFFRLPEDNYYFWQMIFILPGFLLGWLLASGLISLFGKKGHRMSFEKAAGLSGPALALPVCLVWVPQAVQTVLMLLGMSQDEYVEILSSPGLWQVLYLGFQIIAAAWGVFLFALAARHSQSIGRGRAGIIGFVVTMVLAGGYVLLIR
jgi:hypothetical protein